MNKNVPKLRFKEFDDEWELSSLNKLCEINPKNKELPDTFNYIDLESIVSGVLIKRNYVDLKDAPSRAQRLLNKGDVLFQTVRPYQMNNFLFDTEEDEANVASTGYAQLRTKGISYNKFIYQLIHNKQFNNKVMLRCTGTSYPAINSSELATIPIRVPSLQEQEKIADFFTILDSLIEEQDGKVSDLELYKKGMMQKIFSQEIRFKDENGCDYPEWDEKLIGEVCNISTGKRDTQNKVENGKYPFFVRSQTIEKIDSYSFDGEAILTAGDGVGVGKVFHYVNCKFDYHQRVYKLSDFENINGRYLYEYFSKNFKREVNKYNAKTSVDSVRLEMITKMKIPYPCLQEQIKIADFLSNIDKLMEEEKKNLDDLKEMKTGLLQQMFV